MRYLFASFALPALLVSHAALADPVPLIDQRPSVHVTGTASASVAPDKVDFTLTVSSEADNIDQAMQANEAKMTALQNAVRAAGIAPADLQLSSVEASPHQEYERDNRPKPVRYVVSKVLLLCLRNLSRLDKLLIDLSKAKALVTRIEFASDKLSEMEAGLQVKAVANARQRAEAIAAQLGAKVGRPLRIRDSAHAQARAMNAYSASAGSSVGGTATGALGMERSMDVDFELLDSMGR
jgi:uncharacterized protein YggE